MATKKWRNPYTSINKKITPAAGNTASLSLTPALRDNRLLPAVDLRASVFKMRHNLKGISSTIRQVEETMDTLYGAMDIFDSLTKPSSKKSAQSVKDGVSVREEAVPPPEAEASNQGGFDIGQLLSILQSPLVQSLLNQNQPTPASATTSTSTSGSKRKKEG